MLKYTATIEKSATRGAELSAQLLSFARKAKRESVTVNVAQIVDEVFSLCGETFPRTIAVTRHCDEGLRSILGDHGELYQVLLNLCVNARDAVASRSPGGAGNNRHRRVQWPSRRDGSAPPCLAIPAENYVEIRVSDDGIGIPAADP